MNGRHDNFGDLLEGVTVPAPVQELYSGTNNGFDVRDAGETSGDREQQVFHSRESSTNKPELVITFG